MFQISLPSYNQGQQWLGHFNEINNENKHDRLIEQAKITSREVRASSRESKIGWNPDKVKFGNGVKIQGVPVGPATQLPVPHPSQRVKQITWVDFRFDGIDVSALPQMKATIEGIDRITSNVQEIIREISAA